MGRAGSCSACCSAAAGDAAMAEQDAEELVAKAEKKLKVLGRVSREAKRACMAGARRNGQACECPPAPADAARAARPVMGVCGCWRSVRRRKRRGLVQAMHAPWRSCILRAVAAGRAWGRTRWRERAVAHRAQSSGAEAMGCSVLFACCLRGVDDAVAWRVLTAGGVDDVALRVGEQEGGGE